MTSTLLDAGLLFLLRFALDDGVEGVMSAAVHALRALLVCDEDEVRGLFIKLSNTFRNRATQNASGCPGFVSGVFGLHLLLVWRDGVFPHAALLSRGGR